MKLTATQRIANYRKFKSYNRSEETDLQKENEDYSDTPYWGGKKLNEFKEIVLKAIDECRKQQSKQMIEGGEFFTRQENEWIKVELLNQKEIFMQSINALEDLMLRYYDDKITEQFTEFEKKEKEFKEQCFKIFISQTKDKQSLNIAKFTNEIPSTPSGKLLLEQIKAMKLYYKRKKYRELLLLFARKNDLSTKRTVGIY